MTRLVVSFSICFLSLIVVISAAESASFSNAIEHDDDQLIEKLSGLLQNYQNENDQEQQSDDDENDDDLIRDLVAAVAKKNPPVGARAASAGGAASSNGVSRRDKKFFSFNKMVSKNFRKRLGGQFKNEQGELKSETKNLIRSRLKRDVQKQITKDTLRLEKKQYIGGGKRLNQTIDGYFKKYVQKDLKKRVANSYGIKQKQPTSGGGTLKAKSRTTKRGKSVVGENAAQPKGNGKLASAIPARKPRVVKGKKKFASKVGITLSPSKSKKGNKGIKPKPGKGGKSSKKKLGNSKKSGSKYSQLLQAVKKSIPAEKFKQILASLSGKKAVAPSVKSKPTKLAKSKRSKVARLLEKYLEGESENYDNEDGENYDESEDNEDFYE